mmetsp:Transcript_153379/g.270684  ORF Transcript_153379/g.270684 Transcript_153379/m.270684 type:complete len:247 (+) Transcript_153379:88-828(+)
MAKSLSVGAKILLALVPFAFVHINLQGCKNLKDVMSIVKGLKCLKANITDGVTVINETGVCPVAMPDCLSKMPIPTSKPKDSEDADEIVSCLSDMNLSANDTEQLCTECIPALHTLVTNISGCCDELTDTFSGSCSKAFENATEVLAKPPMCKAITPEEAQEQLVKVFKKLRDATRAHMDFEDYEIEEAEAMEAAEANNEGASDLPFVLLVWFVAGVVPAALLAKYYISRSSNEEGSYATLPSETQ